MYDKEWLAQLKIGDEVFVDTSKYGLFSGFKGKVTRLTKTLIIVRRIGNGDYEYRFRKETGYQPGDWVRRKLERYTAEIQAKIELEELKNIANDLRGNLSTPQTRDELLVFIKAIKPFVRKSNGHK